MTSKVNRKTEILTPCRSETPENIEAKLAVNDYVMDPYNLANSCGKRSNGSVPILLTCDFVNLSFPFLPFPIGILLKCNVLLPF